MMTTIEEVRIWIHELLPHGIKPGIERMEWMLGELGRPDRRLRVIHVGGTNGKGSTVSYLREIYQQAGYTIGTFTSPYIESFNERISINGEWISDEDLIDAANRVYPLVKELEKMEQGTPTEFEVITMISIVYFSEIQRCDLVIYEVGLGGRLDSTNVLTPLATVITNIGMDHMQQLGDTIEDIAFEKAGIIKSGVGVITACEQPAALEIIKQTAEQKNARFYPLGHAFHYDVIENSKENTLFNYASVFKRYNELSISLKGEHQIKNAVAALMVIDYMSVYYALSIDEEVIRQALKNTFWPGRFEIVSSDPDIILDGAHNPEGAYALKNAMQNYYPDQAVHIIYAGLTGKRHDLMLEDLFSAARSVTFTWFDFPRALDPADLQAENPSHNAAIEHDFRKAISEKRKTLGEGDVLLITGSLYFISEARKYLINQP